MNISTMFLLLRNSSDCCLFVFASLPHMSIGAPDVTSDNAANLDNTTKLAKAGNVEEVTFDVKVGGVRGDYNKVENSAKVGTINWTVVAQ